jgi:hypothetical protein
MWSVLIFLINMLAWIIDAIGFGYMPAVVIIWCIQRSGSRLADRMGLSIITVNTLLLMVGILSCIDMPLTWALQWIMFPDQLHTTYSSSGCWFSNYIIVFWTTRFIVIGLLPLLFFSRAKRASIKWSFIIVVVWYIWENAMDFLRHGYLCYCDAQPLKTYALLLLTFAGIFTATYWLLRKKVRTADAAL